MRTRQLHSVAAALTAAAFALAACSSGPSAIGLEGSPAVAPAINGCLVGPKAKCDHANLAGADLAGVDLTGASLIAANLTGANLSGAIAEGANFTSATLTEAILTGARLFRADFTGATMLTADALDPVFESVDMCGTRMAKGIIDNRSCPCAMRPTSSGTVTIPGTMMGTLMLVPYDYAPRDFAPAGRDLHSIQREAALHSLFGTTFGGDGRVNFGVPSARGPWAGVADGTPPTGCMYWVVATQGIFLGSSATGVLPGEVYLTGVTADAIAPAMMSSGLVQLEIGALMTPGVTAWQAPMTMASPAPEFLMGSIRLFSASAPLPDGFVPADGRTVTVSDADGRDQLTTLLGAGSLVPPDGVRVPKLSAVDGYQWAIATSGTFPGGS